MTIDLKKSAIAKSELIELIPGWRDADSGAVDELLANAQVVHLGEGHFVFHAGDLCKAFLILLEGDVRVQLISPGGREVTLYRIGPGGSCILTTSCLLSHESYPAEAIAESGVRALAISTHSFQAALEHSSWFRKFVFDGFSSRLTRVIQRIEDLAFTSIDARLATALLDIDRKGIEAVTHQAIAVELGTAREVVSRHLKRFEDDGLVRLSRGRVAVTDRNRLQARAISALGD